MKNRPILQKTALPMLVLMTLFFGTLSLFGQSSEPFSINRSPLPAPSGPVNDYAGVLDAATLGRLNSKLIEFRDRTGVELAVAIVKTTGDRPIFEYSLAVARGWGIGSKEDDNPSALLFVAIDDRKYFTQVSKDLEDEMPDGLVGNLQRQYLVPEFRKGEYSKGVSDTIDAYIRTIESRGSATPPPARSTGPSSDDESGFGALFCCFVIVLILLLIIFSNRGGGGRGSGRGKKDWGGGFGSALPWIIGSAISNSGSSSSSDWGSGWSSGGSDWGGFGGGGDFGGGGAGGDW